MVKTSMETKDIIMRKRRKKNKGSYKLKECRSKKEANKMR